MFRAGRLIAASGLGMGPFFVEPGFDQLLPPGPGRDITRVKWSVVAAVGVLALTGAWGGDGHFDRPGIRHDKPGQWQVDPETGYRLGRVIWTNDNGVQLVEGIVCMLRAY